MIDFLPRLLARVPASVHAKLRTAFLAVVVLLLVAATVGLRALAESNRRIEDLVQLERKTAAYRQLQHDTTRQLYGVATMLSSPDERSLDVMLRQINQVGYDVERLQFVAKEEAELLKRVGDDYREFTATVTEVIELIRRGQADEGRALQRARAVPVANRLERLTNELVNKARADIVAGIKASRAAYVRAQGAVIAFAAVSVVLALLLGYAISRSVVGPISQMEAPAAISPSGWKRRIETSSARSPPI
jgi:CHASE3 domain sensor protein